jgi:hypothetical protein
VGDKGRQSSPLDFVCRGGRHRHGRRERPQSRGDLAEFSDRLAGAAVASDHEPVAPLINGSRVIAIGYPIKKLADYLVNSFSEGGRPLAAHHEAAFRLDHHEPVGLGQRTDIVHRESGLTTNRDQPCVARKPRRWLIRDDQTGDPGRDPRLISHTSSRPSTSSGRPPTRRGVAGRRTPR